MTLQHHARRHAARAIALGAAITAGACATPGVDDSDDFDRSTIDQASSIAGRWHMPPEVDAVAQTQFVDYDPPPPWDGGAHCSGTFLSGTRKLGDFLKAHYPQVTSYGGYSCRPNTADTSETSVHGTGRAIDVFIPTDGGAADNGKGDPLANWLATHAELIGVQLVIWDRSIFSPSHSGQKLRAYGGPNPHVDHLHVELTHEAAAEHTPWFTDMTAPPEPIADYRVLAGDFDGNGKPDVMTISPNAGGGWAQWAALELSTGSGLSSTRWDSASPTHMRNGGSDRDYRVFAVDLDHNGKTDVMTISPDGGGGWADWAAVELSTGSGFTSQRWAMTLPQDMRNGGADRDYRISVTDWNRDGKPDVATISPDAGGGWASWVAMELSTGSGFTMQRWTAQTPAHMRNGGADRDYRVVAGDFNGDGRPDLATISPDGGGGWDTWAAMELSTGTGFTSTRWNMQIPTHMRNGGLGRDYRVLVGDFDGNGKTDIAVISRNGGGGWADWIALELSTGNGFTSMRWNAATPQDMRNGGADRVYSVIAADWNGDGKTDILTLSKNAGGGWKDWADVELSTGSGFTSTRWTTGIPQDMRNGGADRDYRVLAIDANGDGHRDLAVISPNAGGGWKDWIDLALSTGSRFSNVRWMAVTPTHMRNGAL